MLYNFLYSLWYTPRNQLTFLQTVIFFLLLPFSYIYSFIVEFKYCLYKNNILYSYANHIPIVVIGNIIIGGSGKTPIVIELANELKKRGIKVGIISRGYGANISKPIIIQDFHKFNDVGDEPLLIYHKTKLPICVHPNRVLALEYLLKHHKIDIILSDDGLQHLKLKRNIECVVFNSNKLGNQALLPAGCLRENVRQWDYTFYPNNLDEIEDIISKSKSKGFRIIRQSKYLYLLDKPYNIEEINFFKGKKAILMAGIANPKSLSKILQEAGIEVIVQQLKDHEAITPKHFLNHQKVDLIIITEKDAIKCSNSAQTWAENIPIWVITLKIGLPSSFIDDITQLAHNTKIKHKI